MASIKVMMRNAVRLSFSTQQLRSSRNSGWNTASRSMLCARSFLLVFDKPYLTTQVINGLWRSIALPRPCERRQQTLRIG